MRNAGTDNHAHHKNGGVSVSLSGQEKLPAGTPTGQTESQSRKRHAQEIPDVHRVRYRLPFKARFELPCDEIDDQGCDDEGDES